MNGYLPDWEVEEDYGSFHGSQPAGQKVPMREERELVELVWQNGHVIKQNQNHKINTVVNKYKQSGNVQKKKKKYKQSGKHETLLKCEGLAANFNNLLDEEETAAWFQYPLDDTLENDFCSEFFQGDPIGESRLEKDTGLPSVRFTELGTTTDGLLEGFTLKQSNKFHTMPPSRLQNVNPIPSRTNAATGIVNFSHFSRPINLSSRHSNCQMVDRSLETTHNEKQIQVSPLSSSTLSRNCGSNQTQDQPELICTLRNEDFNSVVEPIKDTRIKTNNISHITQDRVTITSSSSVSKICPNAATHKRKERDVDESECQTEETENQSFEGGKSQRSSATRRSRAAEVHNLSERRRRDRINEKMKALQDLIPHCNKTDKASMLDEAIEYLKSLQLQVQMMWMGNGMAPIMFPNAQHYLSLMGAMPPIPSAIQMSTTSCVNQSMSSTSTSKTSAQSTHSSNYMNQIQNPGIPEAFIPYLRLQNMQSMQGINMFTPHASQLMQHNCTLAPTSINTRESINPSKDD